MEARDLVEAPWEDLAAEALRLREAGHGRLVTYSPKVFVPLTKLCRDVCHYCTFAHPPRRGERAYLTEDEVLEIARAGAAAGCHEALFTLGDKPELRYRAARAELAALGCETTLEYLARCARLVLEETGLLPHVNPGVMTEADVLALREVSVSQGLMLETLSDRLSQRGGPHFGSPDKLPVRRLETIEAAGRARVPFTTGILIGIGATRQEQVESLLAIRELGERFGHVQEVIVQNFRAKPGTRMADAPEPLLEELLWTCAAARVLLGPEWSIQAPPNLSYDEFPRLLEAGIDDWGGVSPVTVDHVNPEAPWPELERLRHATEAQGLELAPRLAIYPRYVAELDRWVDGSVAPHVLRRSDADGLAREGRWAPGAIEPPPRLELRGHARGAVAAALAADELDEDAIETLFSARGRDLAAVLRAADGLRREVNGDTVSYVVTRNVNYTNVCYFRCGFCAFSKGRLAADLRGVPYLVPLDEIVRRAEEAWTRGATEICLQGGIHPAFTGDYYLDVCRALKDAVPEIHVHAFSALEVWQGAATLDLPLDEYLARLREAGLASLPGTAAEILDDEVRAVICPDKVSTEQWLEVHDAAHRAGLRSTTTIMFGHADTPRSWARHLVRLREQQRRTGGFTEFVPLPFVHMEAPIYLKGRARPGPTFREAVLVHAVARLALHPWITNIQASWVKLGLDGAQVALRAGANDLGGTLMNESISRAAGAAHGQEASPERLEGAIRELGREPRQRTTFYDDAPDERRLASFGAAPLAEPLNPPVSEAGLEAPSRLVRPAQLALARR
ncbi:MAG TPA: 5-amino-6-(D-ribitylamino)uracil--L-tyrosine 4-hydroxyphenyl transferase CofH [Gaiellaceae bacterium]|nr:5-amino-6-(D-ribitylamino)uracil--L-tyrosine 4-hydroxyphenyl transferase CofH [Gaiellaceae bacterium]